MFCNGAIEFVFAFSEVISGYVIRKYQIAGDGGCLCEVIRKPLLFDISGACTMLTISGNPIACVY